MPSAAAAIRNHLATRHDAMVDFVMTLARAESPSDDPLAQQRVFEQLAETLLGAGHDVRILPGMVSGGQLYARPRRRHRGRPAQLLLGHADTVWPHGTLDQMPVEIRDGQLHGPGVFDMKAGLAQMAFALEALHELGLETAVTPVVFINSDEEVGSPESGTRIKRLAAVVDRTLVLEPALGPTGALKTARKGGGRFTVTVRGKAAHAGLDPGAGASAIVELSHVIQALHALNDYDRGISVNVGTIEGGERANVVAATSRAVVDVRVLSMADALEVEKRILALQPATPRVELLVQGGIRRPPLERTPRNRALWSVAREAAAELGLELEEGLAGGTSDGNDASQVSATLDGLGAVGDGAHADHEFVYVDRLVERAALLAMLLLSPPLPTIATPASANASRSMQSHPIPEP